MAKGSAIIGKIKGHAGNLVFRVRKGEQVIQTKPGPRGKDHLPTYNQAWNYMRFKWASLMSQVTLEITDHSFTRKYMNQSSTNKFIQANIQNFNPINKKCQNMFDLSVEAPLTFNGIQMSTGTMAPVEIKLGSSAGNVADLDIVESPEGGRAWESAAFQISQGNQEGISTFEQVIESEDAIKSARDWAVSKGITAGEMLTLILMTAQGADSYGTWSEERDLAYGLEMTYIRFKLNTDNTTFIIQPSQSMLNIISGVRFISGGKRPVFDMGGRYIVGACIIHSKEEYGGWECDDTWMKMIDITTNKFIENYVWKQNAVTLYQNGWSTQTMPILDPASLTEENQQQLETGRVIETVNANNRKIYVGKITEEVTVSGEDLEVNEKTNKKRSSKTSYEE